MIEELEQTREKNRRILEDALESAPDSTATKAAREQFWKEQADIYLSLTLRPSFKGGAYSSRLKRSSNPAWLRGGSRFKGNAWMIGSGVGRNQMQFGWMTPSDQKGKKRKGVKRARG